MQTPTLSKNALTWIRALRSGLFEQAQQYLHLTGEIVYTDQDEEVKKPDSFCCLGVACELAMMDGVELKKSSRATGHYEYNYSSGLPPMAVNDWLGLTDQEGHFNDPVIVQTPTGERAINSLVELNDAGWTFEQIADLIEKNPDGLFRS